MCSGRTLKCLVTPHLFGFGLLVASVAHGQVPEARVLSRIDDRYAALETIQSVYCGMDIATHPCDVSEDFCTELTGHLAQEIFPSDTELLKELHSMCSVRATPFEVPGVHWLLTRYNEDISRAARKLGIAPKVEPIYGAAPLPEINASVQSTESDTRIILLNLQLLSFVNELAKVSAQSIPVEISDSSIAFDPALESSLENIRQNENLRNHFTDVLIGMLGKGPTSFIAPDDVSKTIQVYYTEWIEKFVFAHEYGHVSFDHSLETVPSLAKTNLIAEEVVDLPTDMNRLALDEIAADMYAARIILLLEQENIAERQLPVLFGNALRSVEFFWVARRIFDDASAIKVLGSENASSAALGDASWTEEAVGRLAACVVDLDCEIETEVAKTKGLNFSTNHPPHQFRQELISAVISYRSSPLMGEGDVIVELVNRNLGLLWEESRDGFSKKVGN